MSLQRVMRVSTQKKLIIHSRTAEGVAMTLYWFNLWHALLRLVLKKHKNWQFSNSHEAQLRLPAYQDLSQALDTSHLHLDLLWSHGALRHGHIWMTWEAEGGKAGMSKNEWRGIKKIGGKQAGGNQRNIYRTRFSGEIVFLHKDSSALNISVTHFSSP